MNYFVYLPLFLMSTLYFSCASKTKITTQEHVFLITLEEKYDGEYLKNEYVDFEPSYVKRSNKTRNEYTFISNISEKLLNEMMMLFSKDSTIISFKDVSKQETKIISSKSNQKSRVILKKD